jgi:selenoprotein W-related protein
LAKAVSLAESLLDEQKNSIVELRLIPSGDGVFEVKLEERLLFSKKSLGRFPEEDEVEAAVRERMA